MNEITRLAALSRIVEQEGTSLKYEIKHKSSFIIPIKSSRKLGEKIR